MKLSLRWVLIIGCCALVWGTNLIIAPSSYFTSRAVLQHHARDIMQNIADLTREQAHNYLALAQSATHLTKRLVTAGVVGSDAERIEALEQYFYDQLSIYPHFAGIYLAKPNGDFIYVSRNDARSTGGFRTKIIRHGPEGRHTDLIWRDRAQQLVAREADPADRYDPRVRPWYIKAIQNKQIVWSDPYIFFTSRKPGITIAGPSYYPSGRLKGIVGVDIELGDLSHFIGKLRVGKSGRAFLMNRNGDVIAYADLEKLVHMAEKDSSKLRLPKIHEFGEPACRKAFKAIQWPRDTDGNLDLKQPAFAFFDHAGARYNAMFIPFSATGWPWFVGVYMPENDYLGAIKDNQTFILFVTVFITLAATIFGLLLARSIIRPLSNFRKEALAVKAHDMDTTFPIDSVYADIQSTADTFRQMKKGLIDYEAELREKEELYRTITSAAHDAIIMIGPDAVVLFFNPAAEAMFGCTAQEATGSRLQLFLPDWIGEAAGNGETSEFSPTDLGAWAGKNIELIARHKDGHTFSVEAAFAALESGRSGHWIGVVRDITERKNAEKEKAAMLQQLQQSQKMEAIGTLAGGIAHDFNNLLMSIQGNASLLAADTTTKHPRHEYLVEIEDAVDSAADLTRQLLGFARQGRQEVTPTNLNLLVQQQLRMFARTHKELTVVTDLAQGLPAVAVDQGQIKQVLLNLFINAWHAMPGGGTLTVSTTDLTLDQQAARQYEIAPGDYARLSVADNGIGMSEATRQRIFEPFFTTKTRGHGTGLGLASAYGIIQNHGGCINVKTRERQGTAFFVYLPVSKRKPSRAKVPAVRLKSASGTVLLVDDEQKVARTGRQLLEKLGYTALVCHSGEEALALYAERFKDIDAVILDVIMPGMGGVEVFNRLKAINPKVKVLVSSGYSRTGLADEILQQGGSGFIQKPFGLGELAAKLEAVLTD